MARMIDAVQVLHNINLHHRPTPVSEFESGFNDGLNQAMWEITHAPTLTQPNEPLTLEKLENMEDTTPVWWDQINSWVLVYKGNLTTWSGKHLYAKGCNGKFYRRPPEGEEGEKHVIEITENL